MSFQAIKHMTPEQIIDYFKARDKDISTDLQMLLKKFLNASEIKIHETQTHREMTYDQIQIRINTQYQSHDNYLLLKDFFQQIPADLKNANVETMRLLRSIIRDFEDMTTVIANQQAQIAQLTIELQKAKTPIAEQTERVERREAPVAPAISESPRITGIDFNR